MSRHTEDPNDPELTRGSDNTPVDQAPAYLVLPEDKNSEYVRPVHRSYVHKEGCGGLTTMSLAIAQTYARDPSFYGSTYCTGCHMHRPVSEFVWDGTPRKVGS